MTLRKIWDEAKVVIIALLVAVVLRTFAYEPFRIPSGSMLPTLLVGDYLFVSKASYGYSRYSLPFDMPLIGGRVFADMPERGDVAVFSLPSDPTVTYIKRIVGLPGDTVQLRDSVLYINGEASKLEDNGDFVQTVRGSVRRNAQYIETMPGGHQHATLEQSLNNPTIDDNTALYRIPEGHFFGMGDNRDNSTDSRYMNGVGFIPFENLIGRAEVLWFSVDGDAWKVWQWPWTLRFKRFFQSIE